jgi:hypothetical protein
MRTLAEALQRENTSSDVAGSVHPQGVASPKNGAQPCQEPRDEGPIVRLQPTGDGRVLARTLARVLVRRALVQEGALPAPGDCAIPEEAA